MKVSQMYLLLSTCSFNHPLYDPSLNNSIIHRYCLNLCNSRAASPCSRQRAAVIGQSQTGH